MERTAEQIVQSYQDCLEEQRRLNEEAENAEPFIGPIKPFDWSILDGVTVESVERGVEEWRLVENILDLQKERDEARTQNYRERAAVEQQEGKIEHLEVKVDQLQGLKAGLENENEHLRYRLGEQ
jgi:hypothetical protein